MVEKKQKYMPRRSPKKYVFHCIEHTHWNEIHPFAERHLIVSGPCPLWQKRSDQSLPSGCLAHHRSVGCAVTMAWNGGLCHALSYEKLREEAAICSIFCNQLQNAFFHATSISITWSNSCQGLICMEVLLTSLFLMLNIFLKGILIVYFLGGAVEEWGACHAFLK